MSLTTSHRHGIFRCVDRRTAEGAAGPWRWKRSHHNFFMKQYLQIRILLFNENCVDQMVIKIHSSGDHLVTM